MALVKKNTLAAAGTPKGLARGGEEVALNKLGRLADENRQKARTHAKQQKAAERVAAATAQLASGITEASSAAEELRKAMEQIAAGAEEAASASGGVCSAR